MIVSAKINYFHAAQVTGKKFLFLALLGFLISQFIQVNNWSNKLIPDKFIILTSSALGIFLGFRINAAYSRWRDGYGFFRSLIATCMCLLIRVTIQVQSKSDCFDKLADLNQEVAIFLFQYIHLVRLELLEIKPWDWYIKLRFLNFNHKPLFSEQEISKITSKKRKSSFFISQFGEIINKKNPDGLANFIAISDISESVQNLLLLEQAMMTLKLTPFPWGYQFYTRMFVHLLPVLFMLSSLNHLNLVSNIMIAFIGTIFLTTEQVARNLDDPIASPFNGIPFDSICRTLEIELLEALDIDHYLNFTKAKNGILS